MKLSRQNLKNFFKEGTRPSPDHFASLIDSTLNEVDDGISKNLKDGLILAPVGEDSERLISFKESVLDEKPEWSIDLAETNNAGLRFVETVSPSEEKTRLYLNKGGKVGIGTEKPKTDLEVEGVLGVQSKIGTYKLAVVPADGKWHDIVTDLNGCSAFEIMALAGKKEHGKYALMHAHALSTFGKSRSKIRYTQAHYGWCWNKLKLRWVGSTYKYKLQIKTYTNYGSQSDIKFAVTKLWDTGIMNLFNELDS